MWIVIGLFLICALLVVPGVSRRETGSRHLLVGTGRQWRRNYGRRSFLRLGGALAGAALLAYSGADEAIDQFHTDVVRGRVSNGIRKVVNPWGERWWFLNWALLAGVDAWLKTSPLTRWGRKNFEAMVVGLPTLWTVQRGLGANRPSSDNASPRWRPLQADNSASGHAFIAAIPWLNLAAASGHRGGRAAAQLMSVLTGWSRINDRKHYLSQVILGWVMAWNAVSAVQPEKAGAASGDIEATGELQAPIPADPGSESS